MKRYAVERKGVPGGDVLTQEESLDTVGEAFYHKKLVVVPNHWKHILVVTSDYHVDRAQLIFSFIFGPCFEITFVGVSIPDEIRPIQSHEAESLEAFRRTFADINPGDDRAIEERLFSAHPYYNSSHGGGRVGG